MRSCLAWATALASVLAPSVVAQALPNLRIQPLGDSITKGSGSSDGNGYREHLRQRLISYETNSDVSVDMIGSLRSGDMVDKDHEGHSGKFLRDIREYWKLSIAAQPNVVLVHAGTNNMDKNIDVQEAPALMEDIIDGIFREAPKVVILVAPVIWADNAVMQTRTDAFNSKLRTLIEQKQDDGKHILEVPINIGSGDLSDAKHPNDRGYEKMGEAWFQGILRANDRGWIFPPPGLGSVIPGIGIGLPSPGDSVSAGCEGGNWERKLSYFDGFTVWEETGSIVPPMENGSRKKVILADLNNDGLTDYILADNDGTVRAWINGGSPNQWRALGKINPSWSSVTGDMVRMADVDNDGKADLIILYAEGAAKVWKNTGNGEKFEALDSEWATGLATRDDVRIIDVDGDGYADYVVLSSSGMVKWARNTRNNGKDSGKPNWETAQTIAPGPQGLPADRVYLYDLDGDNKADYVIVYKGGAVKALLNSGNLNSNSGRRNWDDLGTIAPGITGVDGDMARFADMDGDGMADFLAVADDGSIKMWKNLGLIGSKSASILFADLTGDGKADIISVGARGRARAWLNQGDGKWTSFDEIAPGLDEDLSEARIVFADVNGDKRADYLVVYGGGAVKAYLNNGNIPDAGKGRIWQEAFTLAAGVGASGNRVQFADLNGDGWADYLVIQDSGRVEAYLNRQNVPPTDGGKIWADGYMVATGVGEPGNKVRFADITGDGKDEYLIHYNGGATIAYHNAGNIPKAGKPRNWDGMGVIAGGVNPQGPVRYADINGDGKADYLVVFGDGTVNAYINTCDWSDTSLPNFPGLPLPDNPGEGDEDEDEDEDDEDSDELDKYSTCDDVNKKTSNNTGIATYQSEYWNQLETSSYWKDWLKSHEGSRLNVINAFASEWGQNNGACKIGGECSLANNCEKMPQDKKDSGRAEVVLQSMQNLHDYFKGLHEAVKNTQTYFGMLDDVFPRLYWPKPSDDTFAMELFLGITSSLIGLGTTMAGSAVIDAASSVAEAAMGALGEAMDKDAVNAEFGELQAAELALKAFDYLNQTLAVFEMMHDSLLYEGSFQGEDTDRLTLEEMFEDGEWLDRAKIPILNSYTEEDSITANGLTTWFFNFFHAKMIDFAWKQGRTYIIGYEMSYDESKEAKVDSRLKSHDEGYGYYIFSHDTRGSPFERSLDFREPPGFDAIGEEGPKANFDSIAVIRSSVDTYWEHGLDYKGSAMLEGIANVKTAFEMTPRVGGTFTIPVCILSEDDIEKEHFILRTKPKNGVLDKHSLICMCRDKEDKNGNKFFDLIPDKDEFNLRCDYFCGVLECNPAT